jgi:hypothetical protein
MVQTTMLINRANAIGFGVGEQVLTSAPNSALRSARCCLMSLGVMAINAPGGSASTAVGRLSGCTAEADVRLVVME